MRIQAACGWVECVMWSLTSAPVVPMYSLSVPIIAVMLCLAKSYSHISPSLAVIALSNAPTVIWRDLSTLSQMNTTGRVPKCP